jgi:cytochrome c553
MRFLKLLGLGFVVLVALSVSGVAYLKSAARARYAKHYDVVVEDIPLPFPLSEAEVRQLGAAAEGSDLAVLARERAIERGNRYLETRASCADCHGKDFGGKVIIDNPIMGRWVAPNITRTGVTEHYTGKDWLKIVRHGIKPDRTAASMPSNDFTWLSDQEVSDIAMAISNAEPVDRIQPPTLFGPVFALLIAKGDVPVSAELIDHNAVRAKYPPRVAPTLELGKHLAAICLSCHGPNFAGGPIKGGDPSWPPARNLTSHASGLGAWTLGDFMNAMRKGKRPDGAAIRKPMPIAYTSKLQDAELEALYMFLRAQPPMPYAGGAADKGSK